MSIYIALTVTTNSIRCAAVARLGLSEPVVVSPDAGFVKRARQYARCLGAPLAIADKQRLDDTGTVAVHQIIGEVRGRTSLIFDDFTVEAGTLVEVARKLRECGATDICAAVTHGVFAGRYMERLNDSPIRKLLVTDTVETQPVTFLGKGKGEGKGKGKVGVVSVAPLFAEAIKRIHERESISGLFPDF